ncbi:unnamed protein product [Amaranthus hypochondriacus]
MVFSAKSSSNNGGKNNNNNEKWGMGFFLILFHHNPDCNNGNFTIKKPSSSSNLLLSKTQSTLSICGILVFATLLLFTLSTFEPSTVVNHHANPSRRFLHESNKFPRNTHKRLNVLSVFSPKFTRIGSPALQGMGTLFLRGTKAMTDLIVGHVSEDLKEVELRRFLRVIHHSGVLSRSDFVFIFNSPLSVLKFGDLVKSECESFLKLVQLGRELGRFGEFGNGLNRYLREVGDGEKESIWGKKGNSSEFTELIRLSYGSVVGFDVNELDPEDSLSGFLDHVPISLRRWASYPMLLGRVRRQFKHMMLVDVKQTLILSDPFSRVRNKSSESLFLWSNSETESTRHHGRRNSGKTHETNTNPQLNPAVIVGGSRGVRRFANAALTEIVRVVIEHKGKSPNSVTELGLVNQLVHSGHLFKNINLITPSEPIHELSSLTGFNSVNSNTSFLRLYDHLNVVQNGHNNGGNVDINNVIMREICESHKLYSSVYSDCFGSQ